MLSTMLDWSGTICIISGSIFLANKHVTSKYRLIVFILYLISNLLWIPMSLLIGTYGLLLAQGILLIINIKGIIVCVIEIKGDILKI